MSYGGLSGGGGVQGNSSGGTDFQTPLGTAPSTGQITVDQQRNQLMSLIATALGQIAGGGITPGSSVFAYASVSTNTVLTAANGGVAVDASGGARTLTLPTAASIPGKMYFVKKTDASVNTVTVIAAGADTIDGSATFVLTTPNEGVFIMSFGAGIWYLF